jgi:hypothetical protein
VTATVSRYDLLLALLPLPLLVGGLAAGLASMPTALGVGAGAPLSAAMLAYGLFYDAPVAAAANGERAEKRSSAR